MREIKFRAWHKEAKQMYWFDVMEGNHGHGNGYIGMALFGETITKTIYRDNIVLVDPIQCEIMQFTGLTDKNGVEIYEGDFLKTRYGTIFTYDNLVDYHLWDINNSNAFSEVEIIGNIYENPELL